jgi:putative membrane protein
MVSGRAASTHDGSLPRALLCGVAARIVGNVACDGLIAPLLRLTPPPGRLPWQVNAKKLANHVAWTAAAELVHRGVARIGA